MDFTTFKDNSSSLLKTGPLYAFSLPQELLQVIQLRTGFGSAQEAHDHQASDRGDELLPADTDITRGDSSALRCSLCAVSTFESIAEQRAHFSSDWHRYNIKRSVAGKAPVKEQEWETMVEGLSDSISGTASSSEDESDGSDDGTVSRLLAKQHILENGNSNSDDVGEAGTSMSVKSPLLWFEAPQHIQDTQFGIYRTIFPSATKTSAPASWIEELRKLQVTEDATRLGKKAAAKVEGAPTDPKSRKWTLLAVGGGHFAGIVVSLVPQLQNRNGRIEREVVLISSKTFHRYTTRRKQGGAQSANDNAKSKAKSAGAQIRRYNEAMLQTETRELLTSWKDDIESSELVFLRASKTSQRIFYDYEDAVLSRRDPRIRSFPFPTRRPTQAELIRCFSELTRIKVSHLTREELEELEAAYKAAIEPKKPIAAVQKPIAPKVEVPKLSKEEAILRDRWERMLDMVRRDKVETFQGFLDKQASETGDNSNWMGFLPDWIPESGSLPTVLHYAAANDSPEIVRSLLERRVDPTVRTGKGGSADDAPASTGRTAYECAASRSVREAFRKAFAEHPDWWDWELEAKVPSMLTDDMAASQGAKKAERKNKLKDKLKERAAEREQARQAEEEQARQKELEEIRKAEERRRATPVSGPQRLGSGAGSGRPPPAALSGLSEEAKRRIERERRLRAAEARAQQS